MNMMKKLSFVLTFFVVLGLVGTALALPNPTEGPRVTVPLPTLLPMITPPANNDVVSVADSALKEALHTAAGVGIATPLRRSDLARLSGGLDLSDKGISNIEGLQWCVNLTGIDLSNNKLKTLPDGLSTLTALQTIVLDDNRFEAFPTALYGLPKLDTISLRGNKIESLPDTISSLKAVTTLDLSANGLKSVNTQAAKLTKLRMLILANNSLSKLPKELFQMSTLETLDASGNKIKSLSDAASKAPRLTTLNLSDNLIETLPDGIGDAPVLAALDVSINRLTDIPPSLLSGRVGTLNLDINRIASLPDALSDKRFTSLRIEWNFLDMTGGSSARKIMESIEAQEKLFSNQLPAMVQGDVVVTPTTVALNWDLLADGGGGLGSWSVAQFYVYLVDDGSWETLAEPDKLASTYVAVALQPDTDYTFMIGVEYALSVDGREHTHRNFVPVVVKTLLKDATAPSVLSATEGPKPTATATTEATPLPTASTLPTQGRSAERTIVLPIVLIAIGALTAVALVVFLIMNSRNNRSHRL